ncbi:DUF899 family protein [Caulobacter segnis]
MKLAKAYAFDTPIGKKTLADLFDGRSQLMVYHFMLGPDWDAGCPGCSFMADHFDAMLAHLNHHDVTLVAASRAPLEKIQAYQRRMGWRFPWVSAHGGDFNTDFHVSFTADDLAGETIDYNFVDLPVAQGHDEARGCRPSYRDADGSGFPHLFDLRARRRGTAGRPDAARPRAPWAATRKAA